MGHVRFSVLYGHDGLDIAHFEIMMLTPVNFETCGFWFSNVLKDYVGVLVWFCSI